MSLQDKLVNFQRQQEMCQSMLSSIASKLASSRSIATPRSAPAAALPLPNARPSGPIKFSNDTERLQHINSLRKAPVGAQMKRVIDILFSDYVDVNGNRDAFEGLRKNPKVNFDGRRFSYKAKHDVKNKNELLVLIRKYIEGIAVIDLKDAYPNVMEDLQGLKAARQIWLLSNFDSQEDIAFPNDPRVPVKVDDDLKELFRTIELPQDMLDIERDLQKNGLKPATNTSKRRAAAQVQQGISSKRKLKQKNKELSKKAKLTNAHLPELFQSLRNS